MSKPAKTLLALGKFKDAHVKGEIKRSIVQAELTANQKPPAGKRDGAGRK
jgi:hypothetical protein